MQQGVFKFRSFRRFHQTIGRVDAVVTFSEVAIRRLKSDYQLSGFKGDYLKNISQEVGIYVTHVDLDMLAIRTSQLHIVSALQHFESFLFDLIAEHPAASTWPKKSLGESLLGYVWKHVTDDAALPDKSTKTEWDLLDYYRFARNRFLHSSDKKAPKATDLIHRVKEHPSLGKLEGPNRYNELQFDDFVICARSALGIGNQLCALGRPSDDQIVEMVMRLDADEVISLSNIRRFKNNRPRLRNKLRTLLASLYGLGDDALGGIVDYLENRLLA